MIMKIYSTYGVLDCVPMTLQAIEKSIPSNRGRSKPGLETGRPPHVFRALSPLGGLFRQRTTPREYWGPIYTAIPLKGDAVNITLRHPQIRPPPV